MIVFCFFFLGNCNSVLKKIRRTPESQDINASFWRMSINNSYVVPDIFIVIEEVLVVNVSIDWDFYAVAIDSLNHEVSIDFGLHVRSCLGYWW